MPWCGEWACAAGLLLLARSSSAALAMNEDCEVPAIGEPNPCEDGCLYGINCTFVCTRLESQVTKCTVPCNATDCRTEGDAGDWCDRYATEEYGSEGDDLQCFIVETGSSEGFCSKKGMLWVAGIIMSLAGSLLSNFGLQVQKVAYNKSEKEIHEGLEAERPVLRAMSIPELKKTASNAGVNEKHLDEKLGDGTKGDGDAEKGGIGREKGDPEDATRTDSVDTVIAMMREARRKNPCCMGMWVLGFSGMVTGAVLDFGSLVFAAQSLLAPLAASTLVINIVQAPFVVGEKPGGIDILCTVFIAVGCTLAVAFADHNTATYSLSEMLELWYNKVFVIWVIIVVIGMGAAYWVIRDGNKRDETGRSKVEISRTENSNYYAFFFAALGGQSGGNSILCAKSIGEVAKTFVQVGLEAWEYFVAIGMCLGLALCMYIQLKFLNNGMRHFDVLFVLPIYQAFWITGATINGILFFEEYNNFCPAQYYMFPIGCVLTVGGVAALALKYEQTAALDSLPLTPRSAAAAAVREGIDEGDEEEDEDESPGGLEDQLRKVQRKDLVLNDVGRKGSLKALSPGIAPPLSGLLPPANTGGSSPKDDGAAEGNGKANGVGVDEVTLEEAGKEAGKAEGADGESQP